MIKSFKELGEIELRGLSDSEKKKKFLETQTIVPNQPSADDEDADKYREIIINLDTKNEKIEIKQGKELSEGNREVFFGFKLLGRRSKKIYFMTNNLYYHLLTVPQMVDYIQEKLNKEKYSKFVKYLLEIKSIFYNTDGKKSFLKLNLFGDKTTEQINNYIGNKKITHKNIRSAMEEYVSKDVLGSSTKKFIDNLNIFSLKINDRYITQTKYSKYYINIISHERQKRFFNENDSMVKNNSLCGICNKEDLITGKIDIPTKFYVTSSRYFFENLDDKNAYKSFGICQECYQKVMVGISKVKNKFSNRLFNQLKYYVIPENINNNKNYEDVLALIGDILSGKKESFEQSIKNIKNIKIKNLKVNFLFWYIPQGQAAAFVVADSINDVYYSHLKEIFYKLKEINYQTLSYSSNTEEIKLKFNDIYYLLFPNKYSHNSPDRKLYRKELLNLFDSILKSNEINYHNLIQRFDFIFRKKYFKNKNNIEGIIYHPLKMNILLSWLNKITALKGGFKMTEGKSITSIEDQDIIDFFKQHDDIYKGNFYRQGLFLLGKLINEVLKEQKNKSANILDKVSFDGMPVRRVKKFVNDITEILHIYDKYRSNQLLHSQMIDRLQGIEDSSLNKDEVVFYILSGISFGRYLGHKYYNEKKGDGN